MADTQTTTPSADELHAAFDALLEPTFTTGEMGERETPEPAPEPEPKPDDEPKPAAIAKAEKAETPKVDRRTREGRLASIQEQINDLTAQKHTTQTEIQAAKDELAALRAERDAIRREPAKPVAEPAKPEPKASAFARYSAMPDAPQWDAFKEFGDNQFLEWNTAMSEFIADKRAEEHSVRTHQQQQIATSQQRMRDRIAEEEQRQPGFSQKVNAVPVDERMVPYLHNHPQGPDIVVYLVNHPEIAQRLTTLNLNPQSKLPSAQQIEAIGEIVGALKASAAAVSGPASKPSISHAKPVIKPVTASPDLSDDDDGDDDDLSVEEHIRRGNKADGRAYPRAAR